MTRQHAITDRDMIVTPAAGMRTDLQPPGRRQVAWEPTSRITGDAPGRARDRRGFAFSLEQAGRCLEEKTDRRASAKPVPPTVLCIDDDRLLLSMLCDAMEAQGYQTLLATDGPSGIETAKNARPDVILLDPAQALWPRVRLQCHPRGPGREAHPPETLSRTI